jgi:Uma2 family endonuclease
MSAVTHPFTTTNPAERSSRRNADPPLAAIPSSGQHIVLRDVSWKSYQLIGEALGARRGLRITFDRGVLEIMAKSRLHEKLSLLLAQIIIILCQELRIPRDSAGSTTLDREDLERGIEPDQCFYLINEPRIRGREQIDLAVDPPPDLAVEIDVSRSSIGRLAIYAAIGIPEAWRFDGKKLEIRQLGADGKYVLVAASRYFPNIPVVEMQSVLERWDEADEESLLQVFRLRVREIAGSKNEGSAA